jgi:hypothetical protein
MLFAEPYAILLTFPAHVIESGDYAFGAIHQRVRCYKVHTAWWSTQVLHYRCYISGDKDLQLHRLLLNQRVGIAVLGG